MFENLFLLFSVKLAAIGSETVAYTKSCEGYILKPISNCNNKTVLRGEIQKKQLLKNLKMWKVFPTMHESA